MPEIDRPRLVLYVVIGLGICVLGARWLRAQGALPAVRGAAAASGAFGAEPRAPAAVRLDPAADGRIVVQVAGAVRRPGVYRLRAGMRVNDAVRRAGGAARRADLTAVNLAAKLEDGLQVIVPARAAPDAAGVAGSAGAGDAADGTGPPAAPVDLNTATLEQLDSLDGIGPGLAQRILAYRRQHGGFGSVADLGEVPGIGDKRLAALKPHVRV